MGTGGVLTRKQARFLAEYLTDHNGTRAATAAGYSPGSARAIASQLLAAPHVKAELARLESEMLDRVGATAEQVLRELTRIAFFDVATVYETKRVALDRPERGYFDDRVCELVWFAERRVLKHPSDWPAPARAALASFETVIRNLTAGDGLVDTVLKVKMESKVKALELLANHFGLTKEKQTEINNTILIQWKAPEPSPEPEPKSVEGRRVPGLPGDVSRADDAPADQMGSGATRPGPPDRTLPPPVLLVGSEGDTDELDPALAGGMSRKAQERMFPELRKDKPRVGR